MIQREWMAFIFLLLIQAFILFKMQSYDSNIFVEFQQFKHDFKKQYTSKQEENYRISIFTQNLIKIENHNRNLSNSYKLGITPFVDLTQQQFAQIYLNYQIIKKQKTSIQEIQNQKKIINYDANLVSQKQNLNLKSLYSNVFIEQYGDIDWQIQGHVSIVKNQGACGSSWAFSSTSSIQSAYSIFKDQQILLSEQQLIDCSYQYGNNGCQGGRMEYAYNFIKNHGISTQSQYPYSGRIQQCRKHEGDNKISGFQTISDCNHLFNALHQRPISVAVDASTWPLYKEGILNLCGNYANHGSFVVGVTQSYWKLKNSWGINWGQDGYIRLAKGNTCGICSNPLYPLL